MDNINNILNNIHEIHKDNPDDFIYVGGERSGARYFKSFLVPAHPPEDNDIWLAELRKSQAAGEWKWGDAWPANIPYLSINSDQSFPPEYGKAQLRWESPEQMRELQIWIEKYEKDYKDLDKEQMEYMLAGLNEHERALFETARALKKFKHFIQRRSGIRELCFLRNLTQLKELDLRCNDVEDISEISNLTGLRELNLDYNLVSDISPLSSLTQLATVYLRCNRIEDLSVFKEISTLKVLCLDNNPLASGALSSLRKCKRLNMLSLVNTGITDISDLEYCRVHSLSIQGNPGITGLEVIASMKNLCCLHLDKSVADRYNIPAIAPRFTEYGSLNGIALYVWPKAFYG